MRKLLLAGLILLSITSYSQEKKGTSAPATIPGNMLQITGTFEGEFQVFYQRRIRKSVSIDVGYGHKWGEDSQNSLSNKTDQEQFYKGAEYFLGVRKYFLQNKNPFYLEVLGMYKDYRFDKIEIEHYHVGTSKSSSHTCQIRSSHKQVYCSKFLAGKLWLVPLSAKVIMTIDLNAGFGLRIRDFHDTIYEEGSTTDDSSCIRSVLATPRKENGAEPVAPSLHLGFRLGVAF